MFNHELKNLKTMVCIIRSGSSTHTVAIYASYDELKPILFEGWMANNIAPDSYLTTTTDVKNFPFFLEGILWGELMDRSQNQSLHFGTHIFTHTTFWVDFSTILFKVFTDYKIVLADSVIFATFFSFGLISFKRNTG